MSRRKIELGDVDLNLLVALQALLETRSVTAGAKHVGVTQSAMSRSLGRLRELLGDEVLVRGERGFEPTAVAEAMRDELTEGLLRLQTTIRSTASFVPAQAEQTFRICATEHAHLRFGPKLVEYINLTAPKVDLVFFGYVSRALGELSQGALDVIVTGELADPPDQLMRKLLGSERMLCAFHEHLPVGERLSLEEYVALSHIDLGAPGDKPSLVDELLEAQGLQRNVLVRTQSLLSSLQILACSECVITAPAGIVKAYERSFRLRSVEPPLEIPPILTFMYWHERDHKDQGKRWLRNSIEVAYGESG